MSRYGSIRIGVIVGGTVLILVGSAWAQPDAGGDLVVHETGSSVALSLGEADPFHITENQVVNARLVEVPDSSVRLALWEEILLAGEMIPYYGISLDGQEMVRVRETSYTLKLRYAHFDPAQTTPVVDSSLAADSGSNLYIVQFVTQPLEEYRAAIRHLGGTIYNYLVNHSYIVRMSPATGDEVAGLAFVRSVTPFHPAYRLSEHLVEELATGVCTGETRKYSILVFERGRHQQETVADRITSLGGIVHLISPGDFRMEATLTLDQVHVIVGMDEVMFAEVVSEPAEFMDIARQISGAVYIENQTGFTGQGVCGEVMERLGVRTDHVAFSNVTIRCQNWDAEHGTKVYGSVFGDGTQAPVDGAKGIIPDAEGIFLQEYNMSLAPPYGCMLTRDKATSQLVGSVCCAEDPQCPYEAVFQTNSWGHICLPYGPPCQPSLNYTSFSLQMDLIAFKYDLLICQAQANCGDPEDNPYQCHDGLGEAGERQSAEEAWAKNVVSVGGIKHLDTLGREDDNWCACTPGEGFCNYGCASRGPAADGRVKPDLIHFYDNILTTCYDDVDCYTDGEGENPEPFGGTSGATPITCGYFGLLFQMWHEGVFCSFGGGSSVFEDRPHAATAKALMINTAYRYPLDQEDLNRSNLGWGMVDVQRLYDEADKMHIVDQTRRVRNLGTVRYYVTVPEDQPELRVTLVYADPPGVPLSDVHTVNDLNLKVTSPSELVYWGNCGLFESNWSSSECDGPNPPNPHHPSDPEAPVLDVVENVFLQAPEPGKWTIEVIAENITEDAHVLYLNDDPTECCNKSHEDCVEPSPTDADFALVASGVLGSCCLPSGNCINTTCSDCQRKRDAYFRRDHTCSTHCPTQY